LNSRRPPGLGGKILYNDPYISRDYTDSPEDFAREMTYKRYCKVMDEREKAEDARYTLENMVYPHFDI